MTLSSKLKLLLSISKWVQYVVDLSPPLSNQKVPSPDRGHPPRLFIFCSSLLCFSLASFSVGRPHWATALGWNHSSLVRLVSMPVISSWFRKEERERELSLARPHLLLLSLPPSTPQFPATYIPAISSRILKLVPWVFPPFYADIEACHQLISTIKLISNRSIPI